MSEPFSGGALVKSAVTSVGGLLTKKGKLFWAREQEGHKLIAALAAAVKKDADVPAAVRARLADELPRRIRTEPDTHVALGQLLAGRDVRDAAAALARVVARVTARSVDWPPGFTAADFGEIVGRHAIAAVGGVKATDADLIRVEGTYTREMILQLRAELGAAVREQVPYDLAVAADLWADWELEWHSSVMESLRRRRSSVASPLRDAVRAFLDAEPWHARVARAVAELAGDVTPRDTRRLGVPAPLRERIDAGLAELRRVPLRATYARVTEEIARVLAGGFTRAVQEARSLAATGEGVAAAQDLGGAAARLTNLVQRPRYGRCLPVAGRLGAGKTHLLAGLLDDDDLAERVLMLPLPRTAAPVALEQRLLQTAEQAAGVPWRSLADLDAFVRERQALLVVVIDDLQRWIRAHPEFREELTATVAGTTDLANLRWLVTIDLTNFDDALRDGRFWETYGLGDDGHAAPPRRRRQSRGANSAGWAMLDPLNARRQIGWQIYLDQAGRPAIDPEPELVAKLSQPDAAWLAIEAAKRANLAELLSLHSIELIEEFWDDRCRDPLAGEVDVRDLDEASHLVALDLLEDPGRPLVRRELLTRLRARATARGTLAGERAEAALDALVAIGMLGRLEPQPGREETLELLLEPLWWWRLADALRATDDDALERLSAWARTGAPEHAVEGALQFLLLQHDGGPGLAFWGDAFASRELPRAAVWLAAPDASPEIQAALGGQARRAAVRGRRETYTFMYFLIESPDAFARDLTRLGVLCDRFEQIKHFGLEEYLRAGAAYWLGTIAPVDLPGTLRAMRALHSFEDGVADRLAIVALDVLLDHTRGSLVKALPTVFRYLAQESNVKNEARGPGSQTLRYWLLLRYCAALFAREGLHGLTTLEQHGWNQPERRHGIRRDVAKSLRTARDLALGYWFRTQADGDEQRAYVELVERLVRSPAHRDRLQGFHLIRHSVPTQGRRDVRVPRALLDALRYLCNLPGARESIPGLDELCRANLEDDERPIT